MHVDPTATNATVTRAIRQAARVTGADFQYLLATAQVESNFKPSAKAATSSARGLFQFIEQTWLQTLKEQGPALGFGRYANAIGRRRSGEYAVTEPRLYGPIMNLRSDPAANALMAGAFTRANAGRLAGALGRAPTEGELYIAHFLGPTGASRLIDLSESRPTASAAAAFPAAAKANRSIFYGRNGHARTATEVYRALVGRYQVARAGRSAPAQEIAAASDVPIPRPAPAIDRKALAGTYALYAIATTQAAHGAPAAPAPAKTATKPKATPADTVPIRRRAAVNEPVRPNASGAERSTSRVAQARNREHGPVFHGLFRSPGAHEPVAPIVNSLWTTPIDPTAPKPAPVPTAPAPGPFDFFQEQRPNARPLFRGRG
jgi:hypothetical protein